MSPKKKCTNPVRPWVPLGQVATGTKSRVNSLFIDLTKGVPL